MKKHFLILAIVFLFTILGPVTGRNYTTYSVNAASKSYSVQVLTSNSVYSSNTPFINTLDNGTFVAHRGAISKEPENSLPAFIKAKKLGFNVVETDLHLTKDGRWVVMHDFTVDRTTNGHGAIPEMTFMNLRSLKLKDEKNTQTLTIPTLEEFLQVCRDNSLSPILDIKPDEQHISLRAYRRLLYTLKRYGLQDNTIICSYSYGVLRQFRELDKQISIAVMMDATQQNLDFIKELGNAFIYFDNKALSEDKLNLIKSNNIKFGVWTVNDKTTADYFMNKGALMIVTDTIQPYK